MPLEPYKTVLETIDGLPYVYKLETMSWCDGWKTTATGRKSKCSDYAFYGFKKSSSKGKGRHPSGRFCTHHLLQVLRYSEYEKDRFYRAKKKVSNEG